ncbi:MAG: DUF1553 domain-containing protein, partial [Planctomycetaceae bacterium]|nr:DUF1553 domain-containing protein [Planctomycetaceae bacterium]
LAKAITTAEQELTKVEESLAQARQAARATDLKYTSVGTVYPEVSSGRRTALANWIVHPDQSLTARVAVNHIWMRHFGRPLVDNVFDFGLKTPEPPLVDVLDWLAVELIASGWNLKHIHRVIVTSAAYRRASTGETALLAFHADRDPDNWTWWRTDVRRLEAEVIRDSLLAVSEQIDLTQGGPDLDCESGETVPRRSLYFRHAYEKQMPLLMTFDAANPTDCYRRSPSIVPQQALALSNSGLAVSTARRLEEHLQTRSPDQSDEDFIDECFQRVLCRVPRPSERAVCHEFLDEQARLLGIQTEPTEDRTPVEGMVEAAHDPKRRARQNLVHVLVNHNDFVSIR